MQSSRRRRACLSHAARAQPPTTQRTGLSAQAPHQGPLSICASRRPLVTLVSPARDTRRRFTTFRGFPEQGRVWEGGAIPHLVGLILWEGGAHQPRALCRLWRASSRARRHARALRRAHHRSPGRRAGCRRSHCRSKTCSPKRRPRPRCTCKRGRAGEGLIRSTGVCIQAAGRALLSRQAHTFCCRTTAAWVMDVHPRPRAGRPCFTRSLPPSLPRSLAPTLPPALPRSLPPSLSLPRTLARSGCQGQRALPPDE